MRDILKYVGLFFGGLFVAIIMYPFLHELGHSMMAILVGTKVIDFNLFPLPYVTCEVSNLNTTSMILIGLAGMFVPSLISINIRSESFWFWYCNLVMKIICLCPKYYW